MCGDRVFNLDAIREYITFDYYRLAPQNGRFICLDQDNFFLYFE